SLHHDWRLTLRAAEAMAPLLPPRATLDETGSRQALRALRRVRRDHKGIRVRPADGPALLRALLAAGPVSGWRKAAGRRRWSPEAIESFAMTFPARIRIRLRGGGELVAEADGPRGGAGHGDTRPAGAGRGQRGR